MPGLAKTFFPLALAVSLSQAQVNLAGSVLDAHTKAGVEGASVKLLGQRLEATADAAGAFTITDASGMSAGAAGPVSGLIRSGSGFLFSHEAGGWADIRIYPLTGRTYEQIFAGELEPGLWRIKRPRLPCGVYLWRIHTGKGTFSMRFPVPEAGIADRDGLAGNLERIGAVGKLAGASPVPAAKRSAIASGGDTLLVAKPGYFTRKVPLDNLFREGLQILLTDTAIGKTATVVPDASWPCGAPSGIVPPAKGTLVFTATLTLGAIREVGLTQYGYRRLLEVTGGTIAGSRINGTVHAGGLDLELTQSNGTVELEQILVLRTSDNANIYVRNLGVGLPGDPKGRVILDFEAPSSGSYAWLNTGTYAGTRVIDASGKSATLTVYDVSSVAAAEPKIRLADPEADLQQSPDCLKLTGTKGATVFTENVTLGTSFSIASKRGNRNIIPITGGTTSGRVVGKILSGGADYQLNGLDARYTLAPNSGEYILVRNCGGSGGLVPQFETRTDGAYVFLNSNTYLSSEPGVGGGGVSITFYERR